jgi:hypothetical protein
MVAAIRDCDKKGVLQIRQPEMGELAKKAQKGSSPGRHPAAPLPMAATKA